MSWVRAGWGRLLREHNARLPEVRGFVEATEVDDQIRSIRPVAQRTQARGPTVKHKSGDSNPLPARGATQRTLVPS